MKEMERQVMRREWYRHNTYTQSTDKNRLHRTSRNSTIFPAWYCPICPVDVFGISELMVSVAVGMMVVKRGC